MLINQLKTLTLTEGKQAASQLLNTSKLADIVALISESASSEQVVLFDLLEMPLALKTFSFLDIKIQRVLVNELASEKVALLLENLPADDRTAFLEELPSNIVKELVRLLSAEERSITLSLLGYPEGSVGRLMTPDYITVQENWTITETLTYVRENGQDSETVNVLYIVDATGKVIDDVRIREILFVDPTKTISDVMDRRFLSLLATDDEEVAIAMFRKNNRFALPVTDAQGILLGIVTIDDVLRLAEREDTEDIQKMGGSEQLDEPYMTIPFLDLMKKRAGWLIVLFVGEMLTATAMGFFEGEIAKAVVLALFVPLIISSGGNSGSQASTLIIRAMALGEITLSDWWRVMRREIMSGLFLGFLLGTIGFIRIAVWTLFSPVYGVHWILVASTVMVSLIGVVLWGTISGSMLPLLLKKAGADPATSSAPFVATLVDVTGLVIYFSVAYFFFKGTLL